MTKAFSDPHRRVLTVRSRNAELTIEGERPMLEQFADAVIEGAGIAAEEFLPVRSFWLGRATLVATLYVLGVGLMLLAIPQFSDKGTASALSLLVIGAVLASTGELGRRVMFKPVGR